jgi:anti-sigma B factor antagonist
MVGFTSMEISYKEVASNMVVVTVAGAVMMGSESENISTVVDELLAKGKRTIIFHVAGITKIDSTGMGRFISSYNQIAAAGGEMRIAEAPPFVSRAFHVCRLDTVFRFYPSLEEACHAPSASDAEPT